MYTHRGSVIRDDVLCFECVWSRGHWAPDSRVRHNVTEQVLDWEVDSAVVEDVDLNEASCDVPHCKSTIRDNCLQVTS